MGSDSSCDPLNERKAAIPRWDEKALRMVTGIEKSILALDLDSQGQFIALTNALEMQLESGDPAADVVRLLGDAVLALAHTRRLPEKTQTDLLRRFSTLNERVGTTPPRGL
ncbi:MAG: hypothetical protein GEU90_14890 [Gemmatimonas sp.]|nr:hypothetical protein [Gemmatimonas sp.]